MEQPRTSPTDPLPEAVDPTPMLAWFLRPVVGYATAWTVVLVWSILALLIAWNNFNQPTRGDGNVGHANIDFCGQWLLGRMIVQGHGRHLYDRAIQRRVLEDALPVADQDPGASASDVEMMMYWMVGLDAPDPTGRQVGGPLYPPVHALVCGPLGMLPPRPAYRLTQLLHLGLAFLCGLLIRNLSGGRIWWPVAIVLVMAFPGFSGSMNLGQNAALSLIALLTGWWLLQRGRPGGAGIAWGFLAFKPVWAAAFFLVPLLTRRWRMALAMAATGVALVVLTLPLVGWQSWQDWLEVGRMASERYRECEHWITLSRDLSGVPRRWLLTFDDGNATNADWSLPTWLGAGLWLAVVLLTVLAAWRHRREPPALEGPAAAFVLLGAWLSCYHFMYYDVLLAALPMCLLLTHPRQLLEERFLGRSVQAVAPAVLSYSEPGLREPPLPGGRSPGWVWNSFVLTILLLLCVLSPLAFVLEHLGRMLPFETFCLLALWVWCGWKWWHGEPAASRPLI